VIRPAASSPARRDRLLENGAAAVQVATRFTVAAECGLPDKVKQEYFKASEEDIEVNQISPTGYPMRMIKGSPGIGDGIRPNCEAYGYLLDANGKCAYISSYNREVAAHPHARKVSGWTRPACARTCATSTSDLRPAHLAPEGHDAPPGRRQLQVPSPSTSSRTTSSAPSSASRCRNPPAPDPAGGGP
jgi:hypothetical protein